jgi:hypothetical protein
MTKRMGTAGRLAMIAALALLLTGCLKLDMDLKIGTDNTVSGSMIFAVNKDVLSLTGGSVDDLLGSDSPLPSDVKGVTSEDYSDDKFVGKKFTFESVPITEFSDPTDPEALKITRDGDTFVVSGVLDLSQGTSGASGAMGGTGAAAFLESAEIRIAITFPGEVMSSNGSESGNTVTWTPKFGDRLDMSATGSAIASGGSSSTLLYVLIGVGVVAIIAIIAFVMMSRKKKAPMSQAAAEGMPMTAPPAVSPAPSTGMPPAVAPVPMPPAETSEPEPTPPAAPESGSTGDGGAVPPPPPPPSAP